MCILRISDSDLITLNNDLNEITYIFKIQWTVILKIYFPLLLPLLLRHGSSISWQCLHLKEGCPLMQLKKIFEICLIEFKATWWIYKGPQIKWSDKYGVPHIFHTSRTNLQWRKLNLKNKLFKDIFEWKYCKTNAKHLHLILMRYISFALLQWIPNTIILVKRLSLILTHVSSDGKPIPFLSIPKK